MMDAWMLFAFCAIIATLGLLYLALKLELDDEKTKLEACMAIAERLVERLEHDAILKVASKPSAVQLKISDEKLVRL